MRAVVSARREVILPVRKKYIMIMHVIRNVAACPLQIPEQMSHTSAAMVQ